MATSRARSSLLPYELATARLIKKGYFKAIKAAKAGHWRSLLVSATPWSILTFQKLSLGKSFPGFPSLLDRTTPTKNNNCLFHHIIPPPSPRCFPAILQPYANCSDLTTEEVFTALSKGSPSSTPVPDTIPYSVWKTLHYCAPFILTSLLDPLIFHSHHLTSLK